jgi:hypothetical protein
MFLLALVLCSMARAADFTRTGGTLTLTNDVIPNLPLNDGAVVLAPAFLHRCCQLA